MGGVQGSRGLGRGQEAFSAGTFRAFRRRTSDGPCRPARPNPRAVEIFLVVLLPSGMFASVLFAE